VPSRTPRGETGHFGQYGGTNLTIRCPLTTSIRGAGYQVTECGESAELSEFIWWLPEGNYALMMTTLLVKDPRSTSRFYPYTLTPGSTMIHSMYTAVTSKQYTMY
jgi:hypothetical protein